MTLLAPHHRPRATLDGPAWVRAVGRPGPEQWLWWLAGVAWAYLLVEAAVPDLQALGATRSTGTTAHMQMGSSSTMAVLHTALMWGAMVVATMLPLIAWNVRYVGLRSPRARRARATREVVSGWALAWTLGSVVLIGGTWAAQRVLGPSWTVALAFVLAAGWQLTPVRRRALARCHLTLAPPLGPRATPACRQFGWRLGRDCFITCWATMAAMGAAGHEVVVLVLLAWLSWRDRRLPVDQPGLATSFLVLLAAAAVGLLVA
jgi:hypothetical protein